MTIPGLYESAAAVRHYQAKVTDMQYPKSLGEVCLELAQDKILNDAIHAKKQVFMVEGRQRLEWQSVNKEYLIYLRWLMWHKERT